MESQSVVPRACHNCRVRKIRCNREFPCSNCLTSNISCQPGGKGGRPPPPPAATATAPAASNANNFKGLHDRLERLEVALERLSTSNAAKSNKSQTTDPVPSLAELGKPWTETATYVERDPSFERQSLMAGQFMELAVPSGSPTVANQFKALNDAVTTPESDTATVRQKIRSATGAVQMDHVPANLVLQLIRYLSSFRTLLCIIHPITDLEILKSLCQKIYFPVDPVSVGELTLFNGILSLALWETQTRSDHDLDPQEVAHYRAICEANFSHGVESPEIAAVPTYEHTLALALAGFTSQATGDIVRHQAFVNAAARHCLQLGYHRDDRGQLSPDEALKRRLLFWNIYLSDMSLPLRIGRASTIQDYDIDVPLPPLWEDPGEKGWCQSLRCFIKLSSLRSRIYRKLYSPRAASYSTEYRQRKIAVIAGELQQFYKDWQEIDQTRMHYSSMFQRIFIAIDVIYYSMLTLLYRGGTTSNSPADISDECFVAAKQGLEAHMRTFPVAVAAGKETISFYGVWILLHSSFTPFVVTFLHCVFNSDTDDLNLLRRVLETLQEIAETYDRIDRQYNLCKALYRIAEALLEQNQSAGQMPASIVPGDKTLNIPLQLTTADNWGVFDSMVEGWDAQCFGQQSLMLDNCI